MWLGPTNDQAFISNKNAVMGLIILWFSLVRCCTVFYVNSRKPTLAKAYIQGVSFYVGATAYPSTLGGIRMILAIVVNECGIAN